MMRTNNKARENPNRIPEILDRVNCTKHSAERGVPCFHIKSDAKSFGYLPAICNKRAEKAGFLIPTVEQLQERRKAASRRG